MDWLDLLKNTKTINVKQGLRNFFIIKEALVSKQLVLTCDSELNCRPDIFSY